MTDYYKVSSQAEFDQAIEERRGAIELTAAIDVSITIPLGFIPSIKAAAGALVRLLGGSVEAWESSSVEARGSSSVVARESSSVVARESSSVVARESSRVEAWGSSSVVARESSSVVARESSRVEAWGSSRVEAWESSSVEAWGSSRVEAWESSSVEARESSSVVARESSSVVARGSSSVVARESSSVEARESSSVEARGASALSVFGDFVKAVASSLVSVHLHLGAKCDGGVQIVVPAILTAEQWCEWYGVEVNDGVAIVYKAVDSSYRSPHGCDYTPGLTPMAEDWDCGRQECGGGLHFSPSPGGAIVFYPNATKFLACPVAIADMRAPHPGDGYPEKIKAKGCCGPVVECDRFGELMQATS